MNLKNFAAKINGFLSSYKYFCKNLHIFYIFLIYVFRNSLVFSYKCIIRNFERVE